MHAVQSCTAKALLGTEHVLANLPTCATLGAGNHNSLNSVAHQLVLLLRCAALCSAKRGARGTAASPNSSSSYLEGLAESAGSTAECLLRLLSRTLLCALCQGSPQQVCVCLFDCLVGGCSGAGRGKHSGTGVGAA